MTEAARIIGRSTGVPTTSAVDGHGHPVLTVPADGIDIPDLARHLVSEGVELHTLVVRERALEEVFLTMTGAVS